MPIRARSNPVFLGTPRPAPYLPANAGQNTGLADLLKGATEVAAMFAERKEREDALWAEQQYGDFVAQWTEQEEERRRQTLADPKNHTNYQKDSVDSFEKFKRNFMDAASQQRNLSENVRRGLEERLTKLQTQQSLQAIKIEGQRNKLATETMLTEMQDVLVNEVISTPDLWQDREKKLLTSIAQHQDILGENAIPFAKAAKLAIRNAHVQGLIKETPFLTLSRLHSGEYDKLLTFESKQKLISEAYREIDHRNREEDRQAKKEKEALKEKHDANYADINLRIVRREIKETEIVRALEEGKINSQQFLTARTNLAKENSEVGDHDRYLQLRIEALKGNITYEQVLANRELLSEKQEIELVNLVDTTDRRGGALARDDVKRELDRIDQSIGGVRGPLAVLDAASSMRVANALAEATDRMKARPQDARKIADEVIERYRPSSLSVSAQIQALPRVKYWKGGSIGDRKELQERLAKAYADAVKDETSGRISTDELMIVLKDLERYRDLIEKME